MFSTDFIFRQQENLVDNQKCQAGSRPLCNKILIIFGPFGVKIIQIIIYYDACAIEKMTTMTRLNNNEHSILSTLLSRVWSASLITFLRTLLHLELLYSFNDQIKGV